MHSVCAATTLPHQSSTIDGSWKPHRSHCILRFSHQGTSIKQRLIITKRHISSVFQPMKSKVKARQRQQVSSLVQLMATFAFEFSLLHFTLNSSPRGRQACRRISLVLYLLRSTFLLRVPIERKISLANEDARPTGSAALH